MLTPTEEVAVLFSNAEIQQCIRELAQAIRQDYSGKDLLVICILKGAFIFMADLIRAIDLPLEIDFMSVSSYGAATVSTGEVRIMKDLDRSIQDRHVLIVEDMVDSGLTLHYIMEILQKRQPASIKVCTLLNKPSRRTTPVKVDYVGFDIDNVFIVGYGLDYAEQYRGLPYIGILNPHVYESREKE